MAGVTMGASAARGGGAVAPANGRVVELSPGGGGGGGVEEESPSTPCTMEDVCWRALTTSVVVLCTTFTTSSVVLTTACVVSVDTVLTNSFKSRVTTFKADVSHSIFGLR
jgi:hypothetical protein